MTTYTPAQQRLIDEHREINVDYDWWDASYESFIERLAAFGLEITVNTRTAYSSHKGTDITYKEPQIFFSLFQQGAGVYFEAESFTIRHLIEEGRKLMLLPPEHANAWMQTSEDCVVRQLRDNFERLEREFGTRLLSAELHDVLDVATFHVNIPGESIRVDADDTFLYQVLVNDPTPEQEQLYESLQNDWPEVIEEMLRDVASAFYKELEEEYFALTEDDAVWETIVANELDEDLEETEEEE